jgi:hypothetical protein
MDYLNRKSARRFHALARQGRTPRSEQPVPSVRQILQAGDSLPAESVGVDTSPPWSCAP